MSDNEQHLTELLTSALSAAKNAEVQLRMHPPPEPPLISSTSASSPLTVELREENVAVQPVQISSPTPQRTSPWIAVLCVLALVLLVIFLVRACSGASKISLAQRAGNPAPVQPPPPPVVTPVVVPDRASNPTSAEIPDPDLTSTPIPVQSSPDLVFNTEPAEVPSIPKRQKPPPPEIKLKPPKGPKPAPLPKPVEEAPEEEPWLRPRQEEREDPQMTVGDVMYVTAREPQKARLLSRLRPPEIPSDSLRSRLSGREIRCSVSLTSYGRATASCGPSDLPPFILSRAREILEAAQWQAATDEEGEPCPDKVTVKFELE